jgi:hypothetical protein
MPRGIGIITEVHNTDNLKTLSCSYHKLLTNIDWKDAVFIAGIREGLNKFLSNAFLSIDRSKSKYLKGDFYSCESYKKCSIRDFSGLIYEHIVPKYKYIQEPCEEMAKKGTLNVDFIYEILIKYWKIAIITKAENSTLRQRLMPASWDGHNILARYDDVGLKLKTYDAWEAELMVIRGKPAMIVSDNVLRHPS